MDRRNGALAAIPHGEYAARNTKRPRTVGAAGGMAQEGWLPMQAERSAKRTYGTGSIVARHGDWYGKWRIDGRQVSRKLGAVRHRGSSDGLTRSQAEAKLREKMAEVRPEDVQRVATVAGSGRRTIAELGALYVEY